jgi:hypothetical protein
MFEKKKRNRGLMASKLFDYDEYQNNVKRLQAFTNSSEYLNHKDRKSLTIKYLQNKHSQTKWIYTQLVAYTQMLSATVNNDR